MSLSIAIIGATGHVGKALTYELSKENDELMLFVRSEKKLAAWLNATIPSASNIRIATVDSFVTCENRFDAVINCIGIGDPAILQIAPVRIFELTEHFDKMVLSYLERVPEAVYINFSSGAVYGTDFDQPANSQGITSFAVNAVSASDYYAIAKLNAEAKHMASGFNVCDLRLFAFFSQFIDLSYRYFITDIIHCLKEDRVFKTDRADFMRDFIDPSDLCQLVRLICEKHKGYTAYDCYSRAPVGKLEVLKHFQLEHGLKVDWIDLGIPQSPTGQKANYYSLNRNASGLGFAPKFCSMGSIVGATKALIT